MPSSAAPPSLRVRAGARFPNLLQSVLHAMLVGALALSVAGVVAHGAVTIALSLIAAGGITLALLLLRRGHAGAAIAFALGFPLACSATAMCVGDGLRDVAVMVMPVVLLLGCLVLERRYSIALIVITVVVVAAIGVAEKAGWLPNVKLPYTSLADFAVPTVLLAGLGAIAQLIADALAHSERSYREVFDATHEAICIHDAATGAIVDVNERMLTMYGFTREALPPLGFGDLTARSPGHGPAKALELLRAAADQGPQFFEWPARRADDTEFWVEVTLRRSAIGGAPRVLAVVRDIDERKRTAIQALQSEKLRSLGLLAGGIAHDFNNQLAVIGGLAQLVAMRARDPVSVGEHAGQIVEATRMAADLTGKLLAFARKGSSRDEPVDVQAMVADTAELLRRSVARRIEVVVDGDREHLLVLGDAAQLANALLNLGINARDAMPDGGTVTFHTVEVEFDERQAAAVEVQPGTYVAVTVTDTGVGMSRQTLARAFEPFFTTKPDGTGMGLAQVYGAARAHHGGVRATSREGEGTSITIYLPLSDVASAPSSAGRPIGAVRLGLRVLLAEDEERLARATQLLLEQLDCTVEVCVDGQEAVDVYGRKPGAFDVVLLDLAMPRLSGAAALEALRRIEPEVRVVVTSGYATGDEVQRLLADGAAAFVPKPATLAALVRAMRRAVAGMRDHGPSSSR